MASSSQTVSSFTGYCPDETQPGFFLPFALSAVLHLLFVGASGLAAVVDGPFGSEGQRLEKEVPMVFPKAIYNSWMFHNLYVYPWVWHAGIIFSYIFMFLSDAPNSEGAMSSLDSTPNRLLNWGSIFQYRIIFGVPS